MVKINILLILLLITTNVLIVNSMKRKDPMKGLYQADQEEENEPAERRRRLSLPPGSASGRSGASDHPSIPLSGSLRDISSVPNLSIPRIGSSTGNSGGMYPPSFDHGYVHMHNLNTNPEQNSKQNISHPSEHGIENKGKALQTGPIRPHGFQPRGPPTAPALTFHQQQQILHQQQQVQAVQQRQGEAEKRSSGKGPKVTMTTIEKMDVKLQNPRNFKGVVQKLTDVNSDVDTSLKFVKNLRALELEHQDQNLTSAGTIGNSLMIGQHLRQGRGQFGIGTSLSGNIKGPEQTQQQNEEQLQGQHQLHGLQLQQQEQQQQGQQPSGLLASLDDLSQEEWKDLFDI